jgi:hypothetical protein
MIPEAHSDNIPNGLIVTDQHCLTERNEDLIHSQRPTTEVIQFEMGFGDRFGVLG